MRGGRLWNFGWTLGVVALLTGCGGGGTTQTPPGNSHITLTIQATPAASVTVLSFQVSILGATLNPLLTGGVSSVQQPVSVLDSPLDVELTQLATYSTLLNEADVPEGSYAGITLTFGTAKLTFQNNSGGAVGSCANGEICQVNPTITPSTVTLSSQPAFPISLYANTPGGLQIDFNLARALEADLSTVNPSLSVTASQLAVSQGPQGSLGLGQMNNLEGLVSSVDATSSQFALNTGSYSLTVFTDNNTQYSGFADNGRNDNFTGLQVGQRVRSPAILHPDGTLSATVVGLQQTTAEAQTPQLKGTITSVDSGTQFHMVVRDEFQQVNGILIGDLVAVTLQGAPAFGVESDGLYVPPVLSFASASDLMVGQEVQITVTSGSSGSDVSADRITLRMSDVTSTVNVINNASIITVGSLPPWYTSAGISAIWLGVVPETQYNNVAALAPGQTVAARGLLFNFPGTPLMITQTIGPQIFY